MKKIIILILIMTFFVLNAEAKNIKNDFNTVINDSEIDIESIAVSIIDLNKKKSVYSLNDKILMNPASVQKILTTPVSVEALGNDYEFKTQIYSRSDNNYVIKLGADPYLSSNDLKKLIDIMDKETENVFVDDQILDNKNWGEGWQWDDDLNVLMPRFGAYNLDKNLIKITIIPNENDPFATIVNPSKYPILFFNQIKKGKDTKIKVQRNNEISNNSIILSGTISRPTTIYIPNNNLQRYFNFQVKNVMSDKNIYTKTPVQTTKINKNDKLEEEVTHSIDEAISDIFLNSNNLVSETLFKLAGAKHLNIETGSDSAGIQMFNDYCDKNNLDKTRIKIVDASGVSKNNLVSASFVTDFLEINKDNDLMKKLAKPGKGTLTHRMLTIKNNLNAKTGTLSDISSIAGYLTSKSGKKYAFCIIINDTKLSTSDKKMLEDFIIREAYLRL